MKSKLRSGFAWTGLLLAIIVGWFAVMAAYFAVYELLEINAVPVSLGSMKEFEASSWEQGYFRAKGSYKNNAAVEDGDEMIPQVDLITCVRQTNSCSIAVADVFDHFLNLDVTTYDIGSWTDKQITFADDSGACVTSTFTIDRQSQSFNLMVRNKAVIPDYAKNSPLKPCANLKDKDITLADPFPVYWHLRQRFEQRNGLYFHALLIGLNVAFFGLLWLCWRRRRSAALAKA